MADAKVVSNETHGLMTSSVAGECGAELQRQVAHCLSQLDGQQVFVYVRQLDGRRTVEQLVALLDAGTASTRVHPCMICGCAPCESPEACRCQARREAEE